MENNTGVNNSKKSGVSVLAVILYVMAAISLAWAAYTIYINIDSYIQQVQQYIQQGYQMSYEFKSFFYYVMNPLVQFGAPALILIGVGSLVQKNRQAAAAQETVDASDEEMLFDVSEEEYESILSTEQGAIEPEVSADVNVVDETQPEIEGDVVEEEEK